VPAPGGYSRVSGLPVPAKQSRALDTGLLELDGDAGVSVGVGVGVRESGGDGAALR
jgi:hypothetical protein